MTDVLERAATLLRPSLDSKIGDVGVDPVVYVLAEENMRLFNEIIDLKAKIRELERVR